MEVIQTAFGLFNVYLNRLSEPDKHIFHISFVDKNNKLHSMRMHFADGKWVFINPEAYPDWLVRLEKQFSDLIMKEILKENVSLRNTAA